MLIGTENIRVQTKKNFIIICSHTIEANSDREPEKKRTFLSIIHSFKVQFNYESDQKASLT